MASEENVPFEDLEKKNPIEEKQTPQEEISEDVVIENIQQLEALVEMYPEFKETEEYKKFVETLDEAGNEEDKDDDEPKEEKKTTKSKSKKSDDDDDKEDDKDDDEDDEGDGEDDEDDEGDDDEDDVFGIIKKKKKKEVKIDFDVPKELNELIKKKYAIDDFGKFVNSVDTWRKQAQEYSKYVNEYEEIVEGLQELPVEIKNAISAYAEGKDYLEEFNKSVQRLDYNLPFEKQEKDKVVKHYFPDQYDKYMKRKEKGDIDDAEFDEYIEALYSSAERLFLADKKEFDNQRIEMVNREKEKLKARKESVSKSVDYLLSKFPDFSKAKVQSIKQRLIDGNIETLFYDRNGKVKEEAAEMLSLALYGSSILEKLTNKAKKEGITEANEKIVNKGNKKMKGKGGKDNPEMKKAVEAISHLNGAFDTDPYS